MSVLYSRTQEIPLISLLQSHLSCPAFHSLYIKFDFFPSPSPARLPCTQWPRASRHKQWESPPGTLGTCRAHSRPQELTHQHEQEDEGLSMHRAGTWQLGLSLGAGSPSPPNSSCPKHGRVIAFPSAVAKNSLGEPQDRTMDNRLMPRTSSRQHWDFLRGVMCKEGRGTGRQCCKDPTFPARWRDARWWWHTSLD